MIGGIVIVCAALGLVFLYSSILRSKNIHTIVEMRNQRSKIEKELEEALARRKALMAEVDDLDARLKGVQSRTVSLTDGTETSTAAAPKEPTAADKASQDKTAANWLLKSGQLSLEQFEKVEAYIARSSKEMNFLSACLILGLIDKEAADQARKQAGG